LANFGLAIVDASFPCAQGGSLRVIVKRKSDVTEPITITEKIRMSDYDIFTGKVRQFRHDFQALLGKYKGKVIAGFGAPAKAVTLLSYCGIKTSDISYIVDSTAAKQGRVLPDIHIPIVKEATLKVKPPDAVVLLAWNYQEEIVPKIRKRIGFRGPIIIPFPKLRVLPNERYA
jgi:hypothetical protein